MYQWLDIDPLAINFKFNSNLSKWKLCMLQIEITSKISANFWTVLGIQLDNYTNKYNLEQWVS